MTRQGVTQDVLIAGGGFAAVEAALALRAMSAGRARVTLLSPDPEFVFAPAATMAPFGRVVGDRVPLDELAAAAGAELVPAMLADVRPELRCVITTDGREHPYDQLLVAVGARAKAWLQAPGLCFRGPRDVEALGRVLDEVRLRALRGERLRLAFVVPTGPGWALPVYELALLSALWFEREGVRPAVDLAVVTAEDEPLAVFGHQAAEAVSAELAAIGVEVHAGAVARSWEDGWLRAVPDLSIPADVVVSLPLVRGPRIAGLPQTQLGFVAADGAGRVEGTPGVFVAGDAGPFPVKQAGLACQQADAAAAAICAELGAHVAPPPEPPTLRALLWTGRGDRFLRTELAGGRDESAGVVGVVSELWWPPGKVAGRYLTPFLEGDPEFSRLVDLGAP